MTSCQLKAINGVVRRERRMREGKGRREGGRVGGRGGVYLQEAFAMAFTVMGYYPGSLRIKTLFPGFGH